MREKGQFPKYRQNPALHSLSQFTRQQNDPPLSYLQHNFSKIKFDEDTKMADFKGEATLLEDESMMGSEDILDYVQQKVLLTIDEMEDISKDRVNIKETLQSIKVAALEKMFPEKKIVVNGY